MAATPSLPGPPPDPPADLDARSLPAHVVPAGTVLYRIHRRTRGALHFGPRSRPEARGRWDAPDDSFGVCYLAERPHLAFAETLLRDLAIEEVASATLAARALAEVEVRRDLPLVKLHGAGLRRLRATGAVVQGPYATTWSWSRALHRHPSAPDGVRYHARHDDDAFALAVYDRAADTLAPGRSVPLLDPALAHDLGSWLDRYGIGLGP